MIDQQNGSANQVAQVGVNFSTELLCKSENTDEPNWVFVKDFLIIRGENFIIEMKALDPLHGQVLVRTQGLAESYATAATALYLDGHPLFEHFARPVDRACGRVIVLHEGFYACEDIFLPIIEELGDDRLLLKG